MNMFKINPTQYPNEKSTTDYSVGHKHIKNAVKDALCLSKENEDGGVTENFLRMELLPRYVHKKNGDISRVNPSTSLGDVFSSIMYISNKLENIEKDLEFVSHRQKAILSYIEGETQETEHMQQHISTIENNLRCLRETLCYGELEEEDLPKLQEYTMGSKLSLQ